uniref:Calmodulin binding transcription activator 1 n=1 Tax=Varanus komodoensis TaxID=61221 RepID=A0A8D2J3V4_VARKO
EWLVYGAGAMSAFWSIIRQKHFCMQLGFSNLCVHTDDHGNSNGSHVKIFLPKKLLECLPKCSSLPKERHRWNTNEVARSNTCDFIVWFKEPEPASWGRC